MSDLSFSAKHYSIKSEKSAQRAEKAANTAELVKDIAVDAASKLASIDTLVNDAKEDITIHATKEETKAISAITSAKNAAVGVLASYDGICAGVIVPFAGSEIPKGYLLCNGAEISRKTYAGLFAMIGTVFGEGDGSTTFNLPDYRNKTIFMTEDATVGINSLGSVPDHRHQSYGVAGGNGWGGGSSANNGIYNTTYASADTSLFETSVYSQTVNAVIPAHISCKILIKY